MPPSYRSSSYEAPFGAIRVLTDPCAGAVVGTVLPHNRPADPEPRSEEISWENDPLHARVHDQLTGYFDGTRHDFDLPLAPQGTAFQRTVWETLRGIPFGETRTYGDVAREVDRPGGARAVGGACGANRIPLLIPCHRVLSAGGLGGWTGDPAVKVSLLEHERSAQRGPR